MKPFSRIVGIIGALLLSVSFVHASINATIESNPEYPKAYDPVTLTLRSFSFETDLAKITWKVDGRVFASGYGLKSIKLNAKGTGEVTVVEVLAVLPNNDSVTLNFNLSPQSVDLVWEAVESYTPPFYEGKALPGEGSVIRVTAFPSFVENGRGVAPSSVAYSWSVNDESVPYASGMGKQSLTTRLDYLSDSANVRVLAQTAGGSVGEATIKIVPSDMQPKLYEYDSILGPNYAKALGKRVEITKEISLKLEPFFVSKVDGPDIGESYFWTLDNLPLKTQTPTSVTLLPKEKSYGVKNLGIAIENTRRRLQQSFLSLEVVFDTR